MARIPQHIGIIPDGNRRWAKGKGLNKEEGYRFGLSAGFNLLRAAKRRGIRELTYYGFTVDNCKRPKEQVAAFSHACVQAAELILAEGVALCVIGNTQSPCFPSALLPYADRAKRCFPRRSQHHSGHPLGRYVPFIGLSAYPDGVCRYLRVR